MPGFNDNYLDRSAGLRNFIAPITPLMQPQSIEDKSPLGKFLDIASEAYTPGYVQNNEQQAAQPAQAPPAASTATPSAPAFRDTFLGDVAQTLIPGVSNVFIRQQNQALSEYNKHPPTDPAEYLKGLMAVDQTNSGKYAGMLASYYAQNNNPSAMIDTEAKQMALDQKKKGIADWVRQDQQMGSGPIGAEGNNFTNIRDNSANAWQGQTGAKKGFASFARPEDGFRAAAKILNSYGSQGINTLDGVIQKWAPKSDGNDPEAYADFVSKETGIPRNGNINPADPFVQKSLLNAMQKMEVGHEKAVPQSVVDAGVHMAHGAPNASDPYMPNEPAAAPPETPLQKYQRMAIHQAALGGITPDQALDAFAPTKTFGVIPYTEAGKATSDYQHGLITKDQLDRGARSGGESVITPENAGLTGDAFIDSIPNQDVRNKARALLRGDMAPQTITSRTPTAMKQALEAAQQADPTYSAATFPVRKATKLAFTTGPEARNVNALNTLINHLGEMADNDKNLASHGMTIANYLENNVAANLSDEAKAALNNYKIDVTGVSSEAAKAYKGVGAISLEEQKDWASNLSPNSGPETRAGARQEIARLVAGKINSLESQWQTAFPNDPKTFISKKAQATLQKLGVNVGDFVGSTDAAPTPAKDIPDADRARILELMQKQGAGNGP